MRSHRPSRSAPTQDCKHTTLYHTTSGTQPGCFLGRQEKQQNEQTKIINMSVQRLLIPGTLQRAISISRKMENRVKD